MQLWLSSLPHSLLPRVSSRRPLFTEKLSSRLKLTVFPPVSGKNVSCPSLFRSCLPDPKLFRKLQGRETLVLSQHEIKFKHHSKNGALGTLEEEIKSRGAIVCWNGRWWLASGGSAVCLAVMQQKSPGYVWESLLPSAAGSMCPGWVLAEAAPSLESRSQERHRLCHLSRLWHGDRGRKQPHTTQVSQLLPGTLVT